MQSSKQGKAFPASLCHSRRPLARAGAREEALERPAGGQPFAPVLRSPTFLFPPPPHHLPCRLQAAPAPAHSASTKISTLNKSLTLSRPWLAGSDNASGFNAGCKLHVCLRAWHWGDRRRACPRGLLFPPRPDPEAHGPPNPPTFASHSANVTYPSPQRRRRSEEKLATTKGGREERRRAGWALRRSRSAYLPSQPRRPLAAPTPTTRLQQFPGGAQQLLLRRHLLSGQRSALHCVYSKEVKLRLYICKRGGVPTAPTPRLLIGPPSRTQPFPPQ